MHSTPFLVLSSGGVLAGSSAGLWRWLIPLALAALIAAFFGRRSLRRHRERREKRRQFRQQSKQILPAIEQFETTADFDDRIRLLADITRYCSNGFRLLPNQLAIMEIARFCGDERRKLVQQWVVAESGRLMQFVEQSDNLRVKAGRADQVAESIKVASRLLFPHEKITNAMRSVVQYQEALEGLLELPDEQRTHAADGARILLEPYFQIMEELKKENEELARTPWPGEEIRRILARLEKV